jgi:hypothetical protein
MARSNNSQVTNVRYLNVNFLIIFPRVFLHFFQIYVFRNRTLNVLCVALIS